MNIENIELLVAIFIETLIVILGAVWIEGYLQIAPDYFVERNPFYKGKCVLAKITEFRKYQYYYASEFLAAVEFQYEGKMIESVVQRAAKDQIGDQIAILVADGNFTIRCNWYDGFKKKYRIFCGNAMSILVITCLSAFKWGGVETISLIRGTVIGLCLGYLLHPYFVYCMFFNPKSMRMKYIAAIKAGTYNGPALESVMEVDEIDRSEYSRIPDEKTGKRIIWGVIIISLVEKIISVIFS